HSLLAGNDLSVRGHDIPLPQLGVSAPIEVSKSVHILAPLLLPVPLEFEQNSPDHDEANRSQAYPAFLPEPWNLRLLRGVKRGDVAPHTNPARELIDDLRDPRQLTLVCALVPFRL